jgi:antirestriction protein ArdC
MPFVAHKNSGFPTNAYTNRQYGGINPLLLNIAALKNGHTSKYWATYKQWAGMGCQVKRRPDDVPEGEWAAKIVRRTYNEEDDKVSWSPILVFNASQVFGNFHVVPATAYQVLKAEISDTPPDYSNTDRLLAQAVFKEGGYSRPRYERPPKDFICMPWRKRFVDDAHWYGSCLHELIHWAEWRTGWKGSEEQGELIAEIGQAYLETLLGVPHCNDLTNYNKWLDDWLRAMDEDPRYIYEATAQAEKAVDFVMGRRPNRDE